MLQLNTATAESNDLHYLSKIASEQGWLKLVHYEEDRESATGWRSAIHSDNFFLSNGGKVDPLLELQSTLEAFAAPITKDQDQHAQCRFPARWLWLKAKLGSANPTFNTIIKCRAYDTWTRSRSVSSLSIVFATGYLGNPASYYGHTLLKFNFGDDREQDRLMDVSINYGAIIEKNDGILSYIAKGVLGGYDGGFSHINFYYFNHSYGEEELRDLWEYRLELPQEAVELVVAHTWEVLGKRYTYRFFRYNCAYRMAEILQVIDDFKIIPDNWPWIVPQAMIEKIGIAKFQGKAILGKVTYLPSRQSRFYEKFQNLTKQDARLFKNIVGKKETLVGSAFQELKISSKQKLLDTLLDYYQFVGNPLETAPSETRQEYVNALAVRFQLEGGAPNIKSLQPISPHLGRPIGWMQMGWGYNNYVGSMLLLRFRPAYYDVLDSEDGHVRNSSLIMGDTQLSISHDRVRISRFELVGIESANPGLTRLPGDNGAAWKLHLGAEPLRLSCVDCLVARAQGDIGLGWQWSKRIFSAVYVGGSLQNNRSDQGNGYAKTSVNLIFRASDNFGFKLNYDQRFPVGSKAGSYGVTDLEARLALDSTSDLRLNYKRDGVNQLNIGVGFYW